MKSTRVLGTLLLLTVTLLAIVIATDVENGWFGVADDGALVAATPREAASLAVTGYESGNRSLTEDDLRRIIREELAAYPTAISAARAPDSPGGAVGRPGAPPDSREFERIDQQLDEYIRAGAISDAEMAALQDEIGRLDPAARQQLLGKIVRAMNSGALAGNL